MPPKERGQLNELQVQLLSWWINNGANFTSKAKEIPQNDTIRTLLSSLEQSADNSTERTLTTFENIPQGTSDITGFTEKCRSDSFTSFNTVNALSISMINVQRSSDTLWSQIARLHEQVYFLDAPGALTVNKTFKCTQN
jgi:hypothetical protein